MRCWNVVCAGVKIEGKDAFWFLRNLGLERADGCQRKVSMMVRGWRG
jgi:hypothetical protein